MHPCNVIGLIALLLSALPAATAAQSFPDRTIKIVVPLVSGSPSDAAARLLANHMQPRLGQSVIIENRPGGGQTLGQRAVATAEPDGYTLLLDGPPIVYSRILFPSVDINHAMFAPVGPVVMWSTVIIVRPELPIHSMADLVAYAKANPGKLNYGYGQGSIAQILGASLVSATKIDIANISYRGGEQARVDFLGGRIDINMSPLSNVVAMIKDGKARAIAFTGTKRSPHLPDVPTTTEAGYPSVGYYPDVWLGLFAPAGTPTPILAKINQAMMGAVATPEIQSTFAKLGFETSTMTHEEFAAFVLKEVPKWPPLLAAAGIKPE